MNRRELLRAMLGAAAATALPSEVWPFRKIFLPAAPVIHAPTWVELGYLSSVSFTTTGSRNPIIMGIGKAYFKPYKELR